MAATGISTQGQNWLLDVLFGGQQSAPATYYLGLLLAEPDEDDTGSTVSEPSGGAYARVAVANSGSGFSAAAFGYKRNAGSLTFPTATADWGLLTHFALFDASAAGKFILWGRLTTARRIDNGQTASFAASAFTINPTTP